jgi:hypothetical protein
MPGVRLEIQQVVVVGHDQAGFSSDGALQDSVIVGISGDGVDPSYAK